MRAPASPTLPPAETAQSLDYLVEIDAGHASLARITFRRQKTRQTKRTH